MPIPGMNFLQEKIEKKLTEKQISWVMLMMSTITVVLILLLLSDRSLIKIPLVFITLVLMTIKAFKIIIIYKRLPQDIIARKYTGLFLRISLVLTIALVTWAFNWQGYNTAVRISEPPKGEEPPIEEPPLTTHVAAPLPKTVVKIEKTPDAKEATPLPEEKPQVPVPDEKPSIGFPTAPSEETKEPEYFTVVEEMPEFPGGEDKMVDFINEHLRCPSVPGIKKVERFIMIEFLVDERGRISDAKVIHDSGFGCAGEALRVVKMMPSWKPGRQRGIPVKVRFKLPINITPKY